MPDCFRHSRAYQGIRLTFAISELWPKRPKFRLPQAAKISLAPTFAVCEILAMINAFTPPDAPADFAKLLASKVKVSTGYASELANRIKTPSLKLALEFEREYGIPPSFWGTAQ